MIFEESEGRGKGEVELTEAGIVTQIFWTPQNVAQRVEAQAALKTQVQHLRDLIPDSGRMPMRYVSTHPA